MGRGQGLEQAAKAMKAGGSSRSAAPSSNAASLLYGNRKAGVVEKKQREAERLASLSPEEHSRELHKRAGGTIMVEANGDTIWRNAGGKKHREDGPAAERADGYRAWYRNGELHREDGPAEEWANGSKEWWQDGSRHRTDGPAYEGANGKKEWFLNHKLHREDGPAIENPRGRNEWYLNGEQITRDKFREWRKTQKVKP